MLLSPSFLQGLDCFCFLGMNLERIEFPFEENDPSCHALRLSLKVAYHEFREITKFQGFWFATGTLHNIEFTAILC